jgi:hypothetical protein
MNSPVTFRVLVAAAAVLAVSTVPGFAQTNSSVDRLAQHSTTVAAHVYDAARSAAYDNVQLAPNLTVTALYRATVAAMLERSPTFRRQSARIAGAPRLTISIEAPPARTAQVPAWTRIVRRADGRIEAAVSVTAIGRTAELIAHELEHVIEQLDGIDLAHLADVRASGVRHCECPHFEAFETTRAVTTGQRVAREVGERAD